MESKTQPLSISELYVMGMKKYGDSQTGLEKWKEDLYRFVTPEFHKLLNSKNIEEQRKATDEVSMWMSTNEISFFFRNSWGKDASNKNKALQFLHHAQLLERKFNDQFIIQVINLSIKSCLENRYQFLE